jgi:hypothetical protein
MPLNGTRPLIRRNDLCLCGSGNKYKKCCLHKTEAEIRILFEDPETPRINDWFFYFHPFMQISAAMMMHADLTMPELGGIASTITRKITARGQEEEEQIRAEKDPLVLLAKLREKHTDAINLPLLTKRLLEFQEQLTPVILEKLKDEEYDVFIEQSVRYLNCVSHFPLNSVIELAESAVSPYVRSAVSLLLGLKGSEFVLSIIWRQYHLLREHFPEESYAQGPLFGLYEYGHRFGLITKNHM